MSEIKLELVRLLKFPVVGITVIIVIVILGIDVGNIKSLGVDGVEFHPMRKISSTEKQIVTTENKMEVQLPETSKEISDNVKSSTYADVSSVIGWVYLGTYLNNSWNDRLIEISDFLLPDVGISYVVVADSISVRVGKPYFPFYGLKARVGFANKGDLVKITALDTDLGRNRVWAKVEVYPKNN